MPPCCVLEVAFRTWFALLLSRYVLVTARSALVALILSFIRLVSTNLACSAFLDSSFVCLVRSFWTHLAVRVVDLVLSLGAINALLLAQLRLMQIFAASVALPCTF